MDQISSLPEVVVQGVTEGPSPPFGDAVATAPHPTSSSSPDAAPDASNEPPKTRRRLASVSTQTLQESPSPCPASVISVTGTGVMAQNVASDDTDKQTGEDLMSSSGRRRRRMAEGQPQRSGQDGSDVFPDQLQASSTAPTTAVKSSQIPLSGHQPSAASVPLEGLQPAVPVPTCHSDSSNYTSYSTQMAPLPIPPVPRPVPRHHPAMTGRPLPPPAQLPPTEDPLPQGMTFEQLKDHFILPAWTRVCTRRSSYTLYTSTWAPTILISDMQICTRLLG
jgi:hypothetical protein